MPDTIEEDFTLEDPISAERRYRAERRDQMIASLDEIAAEATIALKAIGLNVRLFFSVPSSGEALITFATPNDPSEEDWRRASDIIVAIVEGKIGIEGLRTNALPCVASGVEMDAADIIPGPDDDQPDPYSNW